jgi:hypothetical protein
LASPAAVHLAKSAQGEDLAAYWQREGLIGTKPDIAGRQAPARALREQAKRRTMPPA